MGRNIGLSFDQAPPLGVPLRFFLTAPVFGLLAAGLLLWWGPAAWVSRWSPGMLALTHMVTLGYLTMVMIGALLQLLPVLAGAQVPRPLAVSNLVHVSLSLGTLFFSVGLLFESQAVLRIGLSLLGLAFFVFLVAAVAGLARVRVGNVSIATVWLALGALGITVLLGLFLGAGHAGVTGVPRLPYLTDIHLVWGLLGWVGLLIIGVAYQVVPMFQITPDYPGWLTRRLTGILFVVLALWSLVGVADGSAAVLVFAAVLTTGFGVFALATLSLQRRRRRRLPDMTLRFWRLGMLCILAAACLWLVGRLWPAFGEDTRYPLLFGLLLVGAAVSVINGMLYKIVPFLVWLHLQKQSATRGSVSNMKEILPDRRVEPQYWAHAGALFSFVAAVLWPRWWTYPAAALFALSSLLLWLNLFYAWRRYRAPDDAPTHRPAASR